MASRAQCIETLESLSPTRLAESWDNVGLLLEPTERPIHRALVTIDLTEAVCDEALAAEVDLVIAYHPPIFSGLKKITQATPLTRSLLRLCEAGVTLWSPHTALDAVVGGMTDWLAAGVGAASASAPLQPIPDEPEGTGLGRLVRLREPSDLQTIVTRLKAHLGLAHVRVATPAGESPAIEQVALCPGAGGSLFAALPSPAAGGPQLLVTGEWSHHHVLAAVGTGAAVVLTDHSNTERGYLPIYGQRVTQALPDVEVLVSAADADPLQVW